MEVMLVLFLILCGIGWFILSADRKARKEAARKWNMESILSEAEAAAADFLEHGWDVAQATGGKYRGTVSVRFHENGGRFYCSISMYDTGDLSQLDGPMIDQFCLAYFVEKYSYYYDRDRDAIVYLSRSVNRVTPEERKDMELRLLNRIRSHPLAVIKSGTILTTRVIER